MRNVILAQYLSLDGFYATPTGDVSWTSTFWNDEAAQVAKAQLFESDALLLGRVTYDGFAKAWPAITDEDGFADRMNALPKYVASRTLQTGGWNAHILQGDAADAVTQLKETPGENVLIYGSGEFAQTLMARNLIDEYRLWVHPVLLGGGTRLFRENGPTPALQLKKTQPLASGVVISTYQPATM